MNSEIEKIILQMSPDHKIIHTELIQKLWSNYGEILRVFTGSRSFILKHVQLPEKSEHPLGWTTDRSHRRKIRSYKIENYFYQTYATRTNQECRIPQYITGFTKNSEFLILLEDLNEAGFSLRKDIVHWNEIEGCLKWLANFHAAYLGVKADGLWKVGTYWHLATRPDELQLLDDLKLKEAAAEIDRRLSNIQYKTFVHGDAKVANFCFSKKSSGVGVAAVDFQYVGGGCGMKDVAYFVGSCLSESESERREQQIIDYYFSCLKKALTGRENSNYEKIRQEWEPLYHFA